MWDCQWPSPCLSKREANQRRKQRHRKPWGYSSNPLITHPPCLECLISPWEFLFVWTNHFLKQLGLTWVSAICKCKSNTLAHRRNRSRDLWMYFPFVSTKSLQSYLTLWDPMDCSSPGSSVHGMFQAGVTRVACHLLLQGIFPTQGSNPGLPHCRQMLYHLSQMRVKEWGKKIWWRWLYGKSGSGNFTGQQVEEGASPVVHR